MLLARYLSCDLRRNPSLSESFLYVIYSTFCGEIPHCIFPMSFSFPKMGQSLVISLQKIGLDFAFSWDTVSWLKKLKV